MLPIRSRREFDCGNLTEAAEQGGGEGDQLRARGRIESGIDFHDARSWSGLDGDEEPSAQDVERQRAYSDWLARFEPRQQRGGEGERLGGVVAHEVDTRPRERAA